MAFRDSINDLMFRFYERFKQNNNRLPVSVDADINVGDVQIGTVKQGGVDEGAEPWKVKAEELEQKIDALKQSIESGVQLKGQNVEPINVNVEGRPSRIHTINIVDVNAGETVHIFDNISLEPFDRWSFAFGLYALRESFSLLLSTSLVEGSYGDPVRAILINMDVTTDLWESKRPSTGFRAYFLSDRPYNRVHQKYLRLSFVNHTNELMRVYRPTLRLEGGTYVK